MSLSFLTPSASPEAPPARSPVTDAARRSGAVVEIRDGWEVIVSCGDPEAEARASRESVAVADLSHLTKLEVLLATPEDAPAGATNRAGDWWVCSVRRDLQLVVSRTSRADDPPAAPGARVTDVTAALCALAVVGPGARELFARFCALDLREVSMPVGGFRPGSIARTPGYLLREGAERYLMICGAAYGAYLWQVVTDAAERLGGRPAGLDALVAGDEEAL